MKKRRGGGGRRKGKPPVERRVFVDPVAAIMSGLQRHSPFAGMLAIPVGRGVLRIKTVAAQEILEGLYSKMSRHHPGELPGIRDCVLWAFFEKASH